MSTLTNDFSWSHARHEMFQACLKRYYFAYYGAWGGWKETAPAVTRDLYRLKRLLTCQQWAGHHVHQALQHLLNRSREDSAADLATTVAARQIEQMRQEFRQSRSGAYQADPVHLVGLFEHEYGLELPAEEWQAAVERVGRAIRSFLASPIWQELRTLPGDAFLAVERRTHFLLDGLKVFAVPDLVVRRAGRVVLYDWKTGEADSARHRVQLGVYALLALDRWTSAPEEIEAVVFNPVHDWCETLVFSADDMETLRDFIRDSADEMLFPLENPETNDGGDGRNFDCAASDAPCKTCSFLRVCPRWQA